MLMLITYDINQLHSAVKAAATRVGFRDFIISNAGDRVPLPNTTLLIDAPTPNDAMNKFISVVRSVNSSIIIERAAAFDWSSAAMHTDQTNRSALAALFAGMPLAPLGLPMR